MEKNEIKIKETPIVDVIPAANVIKVLLTVKKGLRRAWLGAGKPPCVKK